MGPIASWVLGIGATISKKFLRDRWSEQITKEVYVRSPRGRSPRSNDSERNPLPNTVRRLEQVLRESSEFVRIPWDSGGHGNVRVSGERNDSHPTH